jgi:hypothetical protein
MVWRNPEDESDEVLQSADVVNQLKKLQGNQTSTQFAAALSCSTQYLSDVYNGHRKPGKKVLQALGLQKQITYRRWR